MMIRRALFLISLLSTLFLTQCRPPEVTVNESNVMGKWQVSEFSANTPSISPDLITKARQEALSTSYQFAAEQKVWMESIYYEHGQLGSWQLRPDQVLFISSSFEGEQVGEAYTIQRLEADQMFLEQKIEGLGEISMTLKREY